MPVPYFLVTFTVPAALRAWVRSHQKVGYGWLFAHSAAALQEQFDLLIAIRDKVSAIHDTVNEIRRMRAGLAKRQDRAATARLDAALDSVLKELVELRFTGFDDQMLVFDLKLNNRIAALQGYVAHGDNAPPEQQYSVFRDLSTAADAVLSRFAALKSQVSR